MSRLYQLTKFGHIDRINQDRLIKKIVDAKYNKRRKKGLSEQKVR